MYFKSIGWFRGCFQFFTTMVFFLIAKTTLDTITLIVET